MFLGHINYELAIDFDVLPSSLLDPKRVQLCQNAE